MSIALSEFWTRLVREGIAEAADCKRMANAFADANSGSPASDSDSIADFLVKSGELTDYQARCLTSPASIELRQGDFLQVTDKVTVPLSHWLPVQDIATRQDGFLIRVGPHQFSESRYQWLLAHASVISPSLQAFDVRGDVGQGIEIFSPLPDGRSLSEITPQKKRVEKRQALTVGIAVADALVAMHARSLAHGSVRADRVWLSNTGQTVLLRDPSGPPAAPRDDQSAAWIDITESPGAYAAPEFADPSFPCSPLTDIYSLGCLLFRMVLGRLPVEHATLEAEISAHATQVPPELAEAIQQGEAGDPVLRVIAYAMAKSPTARFASAQQLCDALKAVLAMSDDGSASKSRIAKTRPASDPAPPPQATPAIKESADAVSSPPTPPPQATAASPKTTQTPLDQRAAAQKKSTATEAPPKVPAAKASQHNVKTAAKSDTATVGATKADTPKADRAKAHTQEPDPAKPDAAKSNAAKSNAAKAATVTPAAKKDPKPAEPPSQPAEPPSQPAEPPSQPAEPPSQPAPPPRLTVQPPAAASSSAASVPATPSAKQTPPPAPPPPAPPATAEQQKTPAVTSAPPAISPPSSPAAPFISAGEPVTDKTKPDGDDDRPARRRRKKKKSGVPLVLGVLCVPVLMLIVGLIVRGSGGGEEKKTRTRPPIPAVIPSVGQATRTNDDPQDPPEPVAPAGYELVDDKQLLWVPPYGSDADVASLQLLPLGPSVIVSIQLAKMLKDPVGKDMIDALSPELSNLIDTAATRAHVPAESIARCTSALHAGKDGWPVVSLVIELTEPLPIKELANKWQASALLSQDGATVYAGDEPDGDVYYLGDSEKGAVASDAVVKRFAIGSSEQINKVAANEGGAIPLPRLLDKVWKKSSAESDFVALVTPNFLFADGRQMILTTAPQLAAPLKAMLIPNVAGVLVSAKATEQHLYAEFCAVPSGDVTEARLLRDISDSFQSWPDWSETFLQESVPDPSWRLLATRMPFMLRFLVDHTRFGVSEGTVVANTYLPASAASQITVATLLAMNTKAGGPAVAVTTTTKPLTPQEMLDRKMSVEFDQESLEFGINIIAEQFESDLPDGSTMVKVRMIGSDLEKDGITQNQQIRDFKKNDVPLRTVLTDLLLGANPDKTATGPNDPKQSLVWVLQENADAPGGFEILVTTRAAAEGVYELPEEFKPAA